MLSDEVDFLLNGAGRGGAASRLLQDEMRSGDARGLAGINNA